MFASEGKSRADLWELAALVALDLTVERANRACDLDFHARHQVLSRIPFFSKELQGALLRLALFT